MSTTSTRRRYRARVATDGATQMDGNVEFVLDLGVLTEPPGFHGTVVDYIRAKTQMRPFQVRGVDVSGFLTSSFTIAERWSALGKLMDIQRSAILEPYVEDAEWVTYGTGFVSRFGQSESPKRYEMEVSGMSWRALDGRLWTENDTVQLWPAGPVAPWRGFPRALLASADAVRLTSMGDPTKIVAISMAAGGSVNQQRGVTVTPKLVDFIRGDAYPEEELILGEPFPDRGNFKNVRLNYAGVDYEVVAFARTVQGPILSTLEQPVIQDGDSPDRVVGIHALVVVPIEDSFPPVSNAAFVWAPTALPTPDFPYLIGLDSAAHPWGNAGGGIHVADMTRRWAEGLGLVYNAENLAAHEADLSFPILFPWVEDGEEDTERFMEEKIWGHTRVAKVFDLQGRIKLADLRAPRFIPDNVPVLDITNAKNHSWEISEIRNSVSYKVARLSQSFQIRRVPIGIGDAALELFEESEDARLDGLVLSEQTEGPFPGDTITRSGEHPLVLDASASAFRGYPDGAGVFGGLLGRHTSRTMVLNAGRGLPWEDVRPITTNDLLGTLQDGLQTGEIDVLRTLAETIEEGDLIILDLDSLEIPTPGRIGPQLPPSVGPVNPGGDPPTLDPAPTIGTPVLQADLTIQVPVSSVTAGRTLRVEYATSTSAVTPPAPTSQSWHTAPPTLTAPGTAVVPAQPRESQVWIRGSEEEDGLRVTDYSTPVVVAVPAWPDFAMVDFRIFGGVVHAIWEAGALTEGVRILWVVHAKDVDPPAYTNSVDLSASAGTYQFPSISVGQRITFELQAWSGFEDSPDEVTGDLGETVVLGWTREQTLGDVVATLPIDLSSDDEVENVLAGKHGGTGLDESDMAGKAGFAFVVNPGEDGAALEDHYDKSEVDTALAGKSDVGHTHDDRYYTESEVDALIAGVGGSGSVVDITYARTTTNFNFAVNTNWQDIDTGLDLTLTGLQAGDFVLVWVNGSWSSGSQTAWLDVVSLVSAAPVNSWGNDGAPSAGGAGVGNRGWVGLGGTVDAVSGPIGRFVASGDLSAGSLTLRLIGRLNAASGGKAFICHSMGAVAIR